MVLDTLLDRTLQLFILDKVEYCAKAIVHTQLSTDFKHPPTFDTTNLQANSDNLWTGKTLQKPNPNTINCDSDDEMYDEQTCESNEIIDENINAAARNTNVIGKNQELSNIDKW